MPSGPCKAHGTTADPLQAEQKGLDTLYGKSLLKIWSTSRLAPSQKRLEKRLNITSTIHETRSQWSLGTYGSIIGVGGAYRPLWSGYVGPV